MQPGQTVLSLVGDAPPSPQLLGERPSEIKGFSAASKMDHGKEQHTAVSMYLVLAFSMFCSCLRWVHFVDQTDLERPVFLLLQPLKCWNYGHTPLHLL